MPPAIAISASATSSPPSETSCTVSTRPASISPRTKSPLLLFGRQIHRRRGAFFAAFDLAQIDRLAQMALGLADQDDRIAFALEGDGRHSVRHPSIRPTPPMAGVGRMPSPLVSL